MCKILRSLGLLTLISLPLTGTGLSTSLLTSESGANHTSPIMVKSLRLDSPYFRALKGSKNASAYVTITQTADVDDILVGASCDAAERTELHDHRIDKDGVMKMVAVDDIVLPGRHHNCNLLTCWLTAKEHPIALKRGGMHIMFFDVSPSLCEQANLAVTLHFKHAGLVKVSFVAESSDESNRIKNAAK